MNSSGHTNAVLKAAIHLHKHMGNFNTWMRRYNKYIFFLMIFPYEKADPNAACRQQNGWRVQAVAVPEKIYGYVCLGEFLLTLIHAHKSLRAIEA